MNILRETEKALHIEGVVRCYSTDQQKPWNFWVPKSIMSDDNTIPHWKIGDEQVDAQEYYNYSGRLELIY